MKKTYENNSPQPYGGNSPYTRKANVSGQTGVPQPNQGFPPQGFNPKNAPTQSFVPPVQQNPQPPQDNYNNYNYNSGNMPPKKSGNAPMIVAITIAVVVVLALMAFFAYIFFFRQNEENKSITPTVPVATVAVTEEETIPSTQAMTETPAAVMVEVPDLTGLGETDTYKALNKIGVQYTVSREFSDSVPSGHVISQNPKAGTEISKSDTVIVYLSKGKDEPVIETTTKPSGKQSSQSSKLSSSLQPSPNASAGGYICPYSNIRKLSRSELAMLNRQELNLALNEIYARRGRIFKDAELSAYFNAQSWYNGTIPADQFDSVVTFNEYESYNINLISNYQSELGYR